MSEEHGFDLSYYLENNTDVPSPSDTEEFPIKHIEAIRSFSKVTSRQIDRAVRRTYSIDQDCCLLYFSSSLLELFFLETLQDLLLCLAEENPEALHTLSQSLTPNSGAQHGSNQIAPAEGGGSADMKSTDADDQKGKILSLISGAISEHTSPTAPAAEGESVSIGDTCDEQLEPRAILAKRMQDLFDQMDVMQHLDACERAPHAFRTDPDGDICQDPSAELVLMISSRDEETQDLGAGAGDVHGCRAGANECATQQDADDDATDTVQDATDEDEDAIAEKERVAYKELMLDFDSQSRRWFLGAGPPDQDRFRAGANDNATNINQDTTDSNKDVTDTDPPKPPTTQAEIQPNTPKPTSDPPETPRRDSLDELPRRVLDFWGGAGE